MAVDQNGYKTKVDNAREQGKRSGNLLSGARIWFEQNQKDGEDSIGHIISHNFANQEKIQRKKIHNGNSYLGDI